MTPRTSPDQSSGPAAAELADDDLDRLRSGRRGDTEER
jgi:hypothetical protein